METRAGEHFTTPYAPDLSTIELFDEFAGELADFFERLRVPGAVVEDVLLETFLSIAELGGYRSSTKAPKVWVFGLAVEGLHRHPWWTVRALDDLPS